MYVHNMTHLEGEPELDDKLVRDAREDVLLGQHLLHLVLPPDVPLLHHLCVHARGSVSLIVSVNRRDGRPQALLSACSP